MNTFYIEKKCNKCGKRLETEQQMDKGNDSAMIAIEIPWGYFSKKDGEIHKIILCEDCYDAWTESFQIPVEITENVEML